MPATPLNADLSMGSSPFSAPLDAPLLLGVFLGAGVLAVAALASARALGLHRTRAAIRSARWPSPLRFETPPRQPESEPIRRAA